ncbi:MULTISPECIES: hypothetical protein [Streptomyces]|uniref:hypothetical protein n=1 Tax=Streptomyces TaxID=1883 RepID=UPI000CD50E31|nr:MULTISPECIES: hypothetical protein [Streptomyces]
MTSIRTARIVAAAAAVPLAFGLMGGIAQADSGAIAGFGSNASAVSNSGSGVGGNNSGNSTTTQQAATGAGAANQNNTASVVGSGLTVIDQTNATVNFTNLW